MDRMLSIQKQQLTKAAITRLAYKEIIHIQ